MSHSELPKKILKIKYYHFVDTGFFPATYAFWLWSSADEEVPESTCKLSEVALTCML